MKKRLLASMLAFILSASALAACSSDEKTGITKVVLNEVAHSIFYAPMYVAIEEGYFEDEGIELELVTGFGAKWLVQNNNIRTAAYSYTTGSFLFQVPF